MDNSAFNYRQPVKLGNESHNSFADIVFPKLSNSNILA